MKKVIENVCIWFFIATMVAIVSFVVYNAWGELLIYILIGVVSFAMFIHGSVLFILKFAE